MSRGRIHPYRELTTSGHSESSFSILRLVTTPGNQQLPAIPHSKPPYATHSISSRPSSLSLTKSMPSLSGCWKLIQKHMTLHDVRYAIKRVDNFYSDGVVFEGSMARSPWEAGMEINHSSSSSTPNEDVGPVSPHPIYQLRCPPRNRGCTYGPSLSLEV